MELKLSQFYDHKCIFLCGRMVESCNTESKYNIWKIFRDFVDS